MGVWMGKISFSAFPLLLRRNSSQKANAEKAEGQKRKKNSFLQQCIYEYTNTKKRHVSVTISVNMHACRASHTAPAAPTKVTEQTVLYKAVYNHPISWSMIYLLSYFLFPPLQNESRDYLCCGEWTGNQLLRLLQK